MKVRNIDTVDKSLLAPQGPGAHNQAVNKSVLFQRTLTDLSTDHHRAYMQGLAQRIEEQGLKLGHKADIKELQKYRELIGEFINETVSNSYSFHKESSFESRRRHKVLATVTKINTKLEDLAKQVLSGQADNLDILDRVDDIRGLILDIML